MLAIICAINYLRAGAIAYTVITSHQSAYGNGAGSGCVELHKNNTPRRFTHGFPGLMSSLITPRQAHSESGLHTMGSAHARFGALVVW